MTTAHLDRLPLNKALPLAEKILAVLAPACLKIEIAGSIRRGLPDVGDIDIVALPHPGQERELGRLFHSCAGFGGVLQDGGISKRCLLRKSGVQLDLWIAKHATMDLIAPIPCNWGAMLLTYTGSPRHNIFMVERAKTFGKTFRPGWGVIDHDGRVHGTTESEIFAALEMDFIPPADRR